MSVTEPICRTARHAMVEALLASPRRRQRPAEFARHLVACRDCSDYWRHALVAARSFPRESGYGPRLRTRTLARVASNQEHASPGLWLWLAPVAIVSLLAGYGIPACLLSSVFGSVLGSPGLGLAAALLVVGSLFVLLPAGLAVPLILRTPHTNGSPLLEEKGVLS